MDAYLIAFEKACDLNLVDPADNSAVSLPYLALKVRRHTAEWMELIVVAMNGSKRLY